MPSKDCFASFDRQDYDKSYETHFGSRNQILESAKPQLPTSCNGCAPNAADRRHAARGQSAQAFFAPTPP
jgi:hypothetical protein